METNILNGSDPDGVSLHQQLVADDASLANFPPDSPHHARLELTPG